jgi:hypothetical protein
MSKSLNLSYKKAVYDIHLSEIDDEPEFPRVKTHAKTAMTKREENQVKNLNLFLKMYDLDKNYEVLFEPGRKPFHVAKIRFENRYNIYWKLETYKIQMNTRHFRTIDKAHSYVQSLLIKQQERF